MADASSGATAIAALLRAPGVGQLSGPLRIVAVKAAGALVAQRPRLLGRLLPPLLALAKSTAAQVQRLRTHGLQVWKHSLVPMHAVHLSGGPQVQARVLNCRHWDVSHVYSMI